MLRIIKIIITPTARKPIAAKHPQKILFRPTNLPVVRNPLGHIVVRKLTALIHKQCQIVRRQLRNARMLLLHR